MNLIEQAARRLAELQRAGAQTADAPAASTDGAEPALRTPTPEALVRRAQAERSVARERPEAFPPMLPVATPAGAPEPLIPRQTVEIDCERLHRLGLVAPGHLESWIAHELRVLKRPILRNAKGGANPPIRNAGVIMVTSALPGEGKTFTTANLALSMAMEFDDAVLLIDSDVAHPTLLDVLGVPRTAGLIDVLSRDDLPLEDVLLQTSFERLMILPAGSRHHRATELIASDRMSHLMDTLATRLPGRIIVFDSPPLLSTTESRALAAHAGQIVMVVSANSTTRQAVEQALATLEHCDCVMMVLNKAVASSAVSYYGYGQ